MLLQAALHGASIQTCRCHRLSSRILRTTCAFRWRRSRAESFSLLAGVIMRISCSHNTSRGYTFTRRKPRGLRFARCRLGPCEVEMLCLLPGNLSFMCLLISAGGGRLARSIRARWGTGLGSHIPFNHAAPRTQPCKADCPCPHGKG